MTEIISAWKTLSNSIVRNAIMNMASYEAVFLKMRVYTSSKMSCFILFHSDTENNSVRSKSSHCIARRVSVVEALHKLFSYNLLQISLPYHCFKIQIIISVCYLCGNSSDDRPVSFHLFIHSSFIHSFIHSFTLFL